MVTETRFKALEVLSLCGWEMVFYALSVKITMLINFLAKKKCNEAFRGVYTRTNFKLNLILVAVLVLESKGLCHWQIDKGRFFSSLTFLKLLVISV